SQLSEHPYGACLPALEVTGTKALARGELISRAEDCLWRVTALFPGQLISRGGSKTIFREEPFRPQPVVLFYRAQHVGTGHAVPGHHGFILRCQRNVSIQPAMARPISSGESSWRKWSPATVTSVCAGKLRAKSRFAPPATSKPGSAFTNSLGTRLVLSQFA